MAEKRVSVRLTAVGGRNVRAELKGIGDAGEQGFRRLSREMEAANARVATFYRRVQIAAAAAATAFAAGAAAMINSGLQVVDAQAKLAQSLGTTVASVQVLERAGELAGVAMSGIEQATKDLTRRLSQAAADTGPAVAALERLGLSASELLKLPLDERVGRINQAMLDFVPAAQRAAVAGQLFGEEGSIAISRIDTATLRQATADVRNFGVVVSEQDADQIERTNDAISRLGLIWRGLSNQLAVAAAPALEAVADALAEISQKSGLLGQAIRSLFDNMGRLAAIAAAFAGLIAGRWIAGMVAAVASVRGLATALVFLRGALIRTGIGALVVAAGELIFQFAQLVQATGGFSAALGLLGDVASEVWDRIGLLGGALGAQISATWSGIQASIADALQASLTSIVAFGNRAIGAFQGTFDAMVVIWSNLPRAIGDLTMQAANALISGLEAMLNGALASIKGCSRALTPGSRRWGSSAVSNSYRKLIWAGLITLSLALRARLVKRHRMRSLLHSRLTRSRCRILGFRLSPKMPALRQVVRERPQRCWVTGQVRRLPRSLRCGTAWPVPAVRSKVQPRQPNVWIKALRQLAAGRGTKKAALDRQNEPQTQASPLGQQQRKRPSRPQQAGRR